MRLAHSLVLVAAALAAPAAAQAPADSVFAVTRAGSSLFRVNVNGNVGVGVSDPTRRLTVDGGVLADSATVNQVRFADGSFVESMRITPIAAPYAAGWADNTIGGYAGLTYYKDPAGVVHL